MKYMLNDSELNDGTTLRWIYLAAFICFLLAALVTGGVLALIASISSPLVDLSRVSELYTVPVFTFAPEPVERRLFVCGIVIFPVVLAVAWPLAAKTAQQIDTLRHVVAMQWAAGCLVILSFFGIVGYGMLHDPYLVKDINRYIVLISAFVSIAVVMLTRSSIMFSMLTRKQVEVTSNIAAGILILFISSYSLFGIGAVTDTPAYNVHFNTVFHAMVQVYNGKELLVDLTSQYGLFPHFIEPVFRVIGLSVLSFTCAMGVLTAISYALIYAVIRKELRSPPLAVLGLTAVLYFSYVIMRVDLSDPFFQYNPIRLFFPAVTLYMTHCYLKRPGRRLYFALFFTCSAALLWNFDTGIVSFLSWLLVLLYLESYKPTIKGIMRHLLYGGACCIATIAVFSAYLVLRYGAFPDYSMMLTNQTLFYIYGFMMVPMPLFHPWNLIMIVYMAGLVYAVAGRGLKCDSHLPALVFYLSVLGVGLFSYYQGRSVNHCLSLVSYPAFILLSISADQLLSRVRNGAGFFAAGSAMIIVGVLCVSLFAFIRVGNRFYADIEARVNATFGESDSPVAGDAGFVARFTKPGEEVLILSNLSSIYHLVSLTSCPVKIPSPTELFLVEDYKKIQGYMAGPAAGKIIVDDNFGLQPYSTSAPPQNGPLWAVLETRYNLAAISPGNKLRLYVPR